VELGWWRAEVVGRLVNPARAEAGGAASEGKLKRALCERAMAAEKQMAALMGGFFGRARGSRDKRSRGHSAGSTNCRLAGKGVAGAAAVLGWRMAG